MIVEASPAGTERQDDELAVAILEERRCAWCRKPNMGGKRPEALTCSKRCRQSAFKFRRHVAQGERAAQPLRLAYADPPYPGLSRYYIGHPDYAGEVDHAALVARLQTYDGWALSTSTGALFSLGRLLEGVAGVRVASWHKGSRPNPAGARGPLSAWEPVIYRPARLVVSPSPAADALAFVTRARTSDPDRVIGAKPAAFASWVFGLLAARADDQLDDLYPGSGGISRAWAIYTTSPARPPDCHRMS